MDDREIQTRQPTIEMEPNPRAKAEMKQLVNVAFETKMGVFYTFADMMPHHYHSLLTHLDGGAEQVVAHNLSGAVLMLPRHILSKLWLLEVDEDWEMHETGLHARRSELWANSM